MHHKYTNNFLKAAHRLCSNNYDVIIHSTKCVCLFCKCLFGKNEIKEWIETEKTAICPHCGVDAVIGDASNTPIEDKEFIDAMHELLF